jgi:hypothetical protein
MTELTEKMNWMLFEIHKKRWISLSKDDPEIIFDARAKLTAYGLIERQSEFSWKLTKDGYGAVELGGYDEWRKAIDLENETKLPNSKVSKSSIMKIFISHSSKNANYGNALVELLTGIGIISDLIIFTSNTAYGIPIGQNIFNWLKKRINEKPHVIYLLSQEYYSSIACLNEMGAAWMVENEHTMIFTPNFKLDSHEFQNGALDPREIGFYVDNEERLTAFIESLITSFDITPSLVLVNQKVKDFLKRIETLKKEVVNTTVVAPMFKTNKQNVETTKEVKKPIQNPNIQSSSNSINKGSSRLFADLRNGKLKNEEIMLIHYIIDTGRFKLSTGWQEPNEIENIEAWEDVNGLDNILSKNYPKALKRFEMRALTEVSELTGNGNPKELALLDNVREELLDLPDDIQESILKVVENNPAKEDDDSLPF